MFADIAEPSTVVRGAGEDLVLFLWGRRTDEGLDVTGDIELLDELRTIAADVTQ